MKHSTQHTHTFDMVYIALAAVMIAVCSWITVPGAVPFTMQTFAIFLVVLVLGGKRGTVAILLYILLGLIGIPVFSGFRSGPGVLLGTTGGYILGFFLTALIMWGFESVFGQKTWTYILSMICGIIARYIFGTAWFVTIYAYNGKAVSWSGAISLCVLPFLIPDAVKMILAFLINRRLRKAGVV